MTPAIRQIVFINTAHTITHYSLLILPTAVLAMAVPGGPFGEFVRPDPGVGDRHVRAATACCRCRRAGWRSASAARR